MASSMACKPDSLAVPFSCFPYFRSERGWRQALDPSALNRETPAVAGTWPGALPGILSITPVNTSCLNPL